MGHSTEGINGGGYIDPDDMTTKSYKLSDSQNQLVNSGGHLATTLANTIAVSKQNQLLQEYTYSAALLEDDYNNLNEEEKQISESFSKYLDLASFQLLPNNPSLDKEKERATQNFNNKAKDANQKIEKRQNTIKSDMDSQNKGTTLSSQSAALTNSNNTVESNDKTINTNADEVQKCAEEMKAIWQNSVEYKNYKNNPDCQKMAYIAMRKLPQIALQHCISYMQQNDIDGHKKMINSYNELINSLEDCRNYFGGN
jgi:chromosome segregation ATPase